VGDRVLETASDDNLRIGAPAETIIPNQETNMSQNETPQNPPVEQLDTDSLDQVVGGALASAPDAQRQEQSQKLRMEDASK